MTRKPRQEALQGAAPCAPSGPLVLDLRGRAITQEAFWDALSAGCQLPRWFGRNLDAWRDTLRRGMSPLLDAHARLVVQADAAGIFAPGCSYGRRLAGVFEEAAERACLELYRDGMQLDLQAWRDAPHSPRGGAR
ncbi:hypothetical protein ABPG75_011223 [Micractinium tetrahymenae]